MMIMRYILITAFTYAALLIYSFAAMAQESETQAKAVLAGGCFWCLENDVMKLDGVIDAVSGYAGGERPNPTYENYNDVTDNFPTPHIEVVEITYNPETLPYNELLDAYLRMIDPTDGEGQFCDRGPAYRPAIFAMNDNERNVARNALSQAQDVIGKEIDVDILPQAQFWPAEDYHQDYAKKNAIRYNVYRWKCGRDDRINEIWSAE